MYLVGRRFEAGWATERERVAKFAAAASSERAAMIEEERAAIMKQVVDEHQEEQAAMWQICPSKYGDKYALCVRPHPTSGRFKYPTRPSKGRTRQYLLDSHGV